MAELSRARGGLWVLSDCANPNVNEITGIGDACFTRPLSLDELRWAMAVDASFQAY